MSSELRSLGDNDDLRSQNDQLWRKVESLQNYMVKLQQILEAQHINVPPYVDVTSRRSSRNGVSSSGNGGSNIPRPITTTATLMTRIDEPIINEYSPLGYYRDLSYNMPLNVSYGESWNNSRNQTRSTRHGHSLSIGSVDEGFANNKRRPSNPLAPPPSPQKEFMGGDEQDNIRRDQTLRSLSTTGSRTKRTTRHNSYDETYDNERSAIY